MKNLSKFKPLAIIVSHVLVIVAGLLIVTSNILIDNQNYINTAFSLVTSEIVPNPNIDPTDPMYTYYKTDFNSVKEVEENGANYAYKVVAEGSTLLKNDNALPLAKGSKVSLFSVNSVRPVYCGTGSGASSREDQVDFKTGFEKNGNLFVNPALWSWYNENANTYGRATFNPGQNEGSGGTSMSNRKRISYMEGVLDAKWSDIKENANKTDSEYGDAAIFVLSRQSGEGADVIIENSSLAASTTTNGNVLELGVNEKDVLMNLKALKGTTFKKIIVLMNSASQIQCDFVNDPAYGIDALVWCGAFGDQGPVALGDLLVGNVNFSGKLSDTFFTKHAYNPVYANWIPQAYSGGIEVSGNESTTLNDNKVMGNYYVVYQEGIYNGYRYTETRYEDTVLGRPNAGTFNYDEVVAYPFGFGLSYSNFEYSGFKVDPPTPRTGDVYTVSITVTNKSATPGKESVQIYLQKPYTQYDIDNGIEKPAVELVGFDKTTKVLGLNDIETLKIEIPGSYFASYDSNNARTFILDDGDYYLTAAKDAHSAINNIISAKQNGTHSFVYKKNVATFDKTTYAISAATEKPITNQFDNADLNKYDGRESNSVTYLSRNDWQGTIKFGYSIGGDGVTRTKLNNSVVVVGTQKMKTDAAKPTVQKSDDDYPTYRPEGEEATLSLIDVLSIYEEGLDDKSNTPTYIRPYDDPMWDKLLDQLSWNDTVTLLSDGFRQTQGIASIAKPPTLDPNGPNGLVGYEDKTSYAVLGNFNNLGRGLAVKYDDPDKNKSATGYPCNGLVASTFNKTLAREFGKAWGEDCLWAGVSGIYGTGVNMHRGAYNGRTFEYFSEDPILSGKIAAGVTLGLKDKGVYSYLKHATLNDSEAARKASSAWANEQTIREIYLRPFQIAIEEGKGECIMTGYNRIGVLWTGHHGFLNTVFRDEYGMTGHTVSDYFNTQYMTVPVGIMNGNDIPDNAGSIGDDLNNYGPNKGYGEFARAMRESAKRILYTVVQSNAMNGFTTGTKIIMHYPTWAKTLKTSTIIVSVVSGVVVLASIGLLLVVELQKKGILVFSKKKKEQTNE